MTTDPLIPLLISSTALITLFAVYFTIFLIVHKNKQRQNLLEKQRLRHEYESELLNSKLEIQEETLNRVSMEIHDSICQNLGGIKHLLARAATDNPESQAAGIAEASVMLSDNIAKLRSISHTMNTNHVQNIGLLESAQEEVNIQKAIHGRSILLTVTGSGEDLPDEAELLIFRILQEAMSNSIKHGQAENIDVSMDFQADAFKMKIQDDGCGFDMPGTVQNTGIGLMNMKQRVQMMNGILSIKSAKGKGTEITISINRNNNQK